MKLYGLQKTTLLDFPGHLACTVFLYGCNFRCSFCQNKELVLLPDDSSDGKQQSADRMNTLSTDEFFYFLSKRKHILEGVCITGGEPSLYGEELIGFIKKIRSLGFKVKLDTNGSNPEVLNQLFDQNLLDYIAMDIKSSRFRYEAVCDSPVDIDRICRSVQLIMEQTCPYEFRTTLVKELHTEDDVLDIKTWISGAKAYFLQSYQPSEQCICSSYHPFSKDELLHFQELLQEKIPNTHLRGVS